VAVFLRDTVGELLRQGLKARPVSTCINYGQMVSECRSTGAPLNVYLRVTERLVVGAEPNIAEFCCEDVLPRRTSIQYPFHLKSWGSPYLGIYSALPGSADKDMPPLS
jgi:hypothetical protein